VSRDVSVTAPQKADAFVGSPVFPRVARNLGKYEATPIIRSCQGREPSRRIHRPTSSLMWRAIVNIAMCCWKLRFLAVVQAEYGRKVRYAWTRPTSKWNADRWIRSCNYRLPRP